MKGLTGIVTVLAVLAALLLTPFQHTDVSELLPVQTLCLRRENGLCRLETDGGLMGQGMDARQALRDLERTAPGVAELSTTRVLVVEDAAAPYLAGLLRCGVLRPGTELYRSPAPVDVADAAGFLSRHGVDTTVARLQAAWLTGEAMHLPCLVGGEGRYEIVEATKP